MGKKAEAEVPAVQNANMPVKTKGALAELLERSRNSFEEMATKYLPADRIFKLAAVAMSRDPKIADCTGVSILKSVMDACQMGLDCSGINGQGWILPYRNKKTNKTEAQFIPGYRGLTEIARRSGAVEDIDAQLVYANDVFRIRMGSNPGIDHEPETRGDRGEFLGAYAVATLATGKQKSEWMDAADIDNTKKSSRSAGSDYSPWNTFAGEMRRKTVIKRICKYLPYDATLQLAIDADNRAHGLSEAVTGINLPGKKRANPAGLDLPEAREAEAEPDESNDDKLRESFVSSYDKWRKKLGMTTAEFDDLISLCVDDKSTAALEDRLAELESIIKSEKAEAKSQ